MFIAATAINSGRDDYVVGVTAATQAVAELQQQVPGALPQVVFIFASITYVHREVLKGIRSVVGPDAVMVGASTAGEITNAGPSTRPSVALMCIYTDSVYFAATVEEDMTSDSEGVGARVGISLLQHTPGALELIMMMADGLRGDPSAVVRGVTSQLGTRFPVVGGTAGDDGKFIETKQFFQEEVLTDAAVGVGVSGRFTHAIGIRHGWIPVGAPRQITHAEGTLVRTIDDKPAIDLYADYLGADTAASLLGYALGTVALSYPLGVVGTGAQGEMLLRAPLKLNHDGSVLFGAELKTGDMVQLMIGHKEDAIEAAEHAASSAMEQLGQKPQAAFMFNCYIRRSLFENDAAAIAEIQAVQAIIGKDTPLIGFYTYSEIAAQDQVTPVEQNPEVHNETMVLLLVAET